MATRAETIAPSVAAAPPGPLREFWYYFSENKGAVAGLWVIVVVVLSAVFADVVAPHGAAEQYRDHFLTPPFWEQGGTIEFPLGTDAVGRDILSRIIHGARYSLFIGLIVVATWRCAAAFCRSLDPADALLLGLMLHFAATGFLEANASPPSFDLLILFAGISRLAFRAPAFEFAGMTNRLCPA